MKKKVVSVVILIVLIVSIFPIIVSAAFTQRKSAPSSTDWYYTTGNVFYTSGCGMPNCTAYAYGRAYELLGSKPKVSTGNAGQWWNYNKNGKYYSYGSEPKLGAIACWDHNDNNTGHVAVVEEINGNNIVISESHYGGTYWDRKTIPKNGYYSGLHFQGYIYIGNWDNPEPQPANLGDNFYAVILHKDSWKPLSYDEDGYVRLKTETGTANQVWRFVRQSDGAYVIASTKNNRLLELTAGDTTNGKPASVGVEDWGGYYQRWYLYEYGGGYIIQSKHYTNLNRVLDLDNGNTNDGTAILTYQRNNGRNQVWAIYRGDEIKMTSPQLEVKTENSVITLNWSDIYGELSYFVHIYKDGVLYKETVIPYGNGCSYSESLPDGNYTAYVAAHNAFEAKDSNTVSFSILNGEKAPDTWIKANKSTYYVGDSAVFNFGYKYTTSVSLGIDKDGKRYANPEVTGKTSYSYLLPETGTYSIYVSGWSQSGYEDSKRVVITVKERPPEINSSIESYSNTHIVKTNIANLKQSAVYAAALYSAEGKLLDIQTAPLLSGATTADIALPKHPDAKYIKVFLWDSLDTMKPLCDYEEIDL